eukprot:scaffold9098_cov124-Isochrysis_galbana.AAC.3
MAAVRASRSRRDASFSRRTRTRSAVQKAVGSSVHSRSPRASATTTTATASEASSSASSRSGVPSSSSSTADTSSTSADAQSTPPFQLTGAATGQAAPAHGGRSVTGARGTGATSAPIGHSSNAKAPNGLVSDARSAETRSLDATGTITPLVPHCANNSGDCDNAAPAPSAAQPPKSARTASPRAAPNSALGSTAAASKDRKAVAEATEREMRRVVCCIASPAAAPIAERTRTCPAVLAYSSRRAVASSRTKPLAKPPSVTRRTATLPAARTAGSIPTTSRSVLSLEARPATAPASAS